jgi:uncharacterized protein (TIGR02001 family)
MKKVKFFQLAAAATALMAGVGSASSANAETAVSFNVGAATDYVFRGIDQTGPLTEGEVFGGVDASIDAFYAGAWVSNTGSDVARFMEYDLYGGWKPTLGPVALDLGFIYYGYTDSDVTGGDESDLSTYELKVAGSVPVGGATLGAALFWTPNFSGDADGLDDNNGLYYEVNAAYTFSNSATLSGAIGAVDVDDYAIDGYTTWNVGVSYPITDHFSVDARYIGTDDDALFFAGNGDTAVGTLKVTF